jgi:exosortase/archaeosortase family protein
MPKNKGKKDKSGNHTKTKANKQFLKQFAPLMTAVILWIATSTILHLPSIKDEVAAFFINFTLQSSLLFGKIFFIPMSSSAFPFITIGGYTMQIVMECTAYNFYIFVFYLSLLSPVSFKQRIITLLIFLIAVFFVNNLRFITVGYIGNYSQELFHLVHDYLWNILFGFLVFLIWAWRYNKTYYAGDENGNTENIN